MKKLLLIDGSSLLHRAFYALPLLTNSQGQYTNGVHGFMMMFNRLLQQMQPDHIVVCFDKSRISFRNDMFADYKAGRKETPAELKGQFELLKQVLDAAGVAWLEMDGYEADDLLATLSAAAQEDFSVDIISGDRDILQLIGEHARVYLTKKGITDIECWDEAAFRQKYGVGPERLPDIKGLMGDTSDNIPGVPGVGEKTAVKLLTAYGSLEELYAHLPQVKQEKLRQKLETYKEQAFLSRDLATVNRQAPMVVDWQANRYQAGMDRPQLREIYQRLELRQLLRGLAGKSEGENAASRSAAGKAAKADAGQETQAGNSPVEDWQAVLDTARRDGRCGAVAVYAGTGFGKTLTALAVAAGEQAAFAEGDTALELLRFFREIWQDGSIAKYTADGKELQVLCRANDMALTGVREDAILAAYLLDPAAGSYDIAAIAEKNGVYPPPASAPAATAALILPPLLEKLHKQLQDTGMENLYRGLELPLSPVLANMEWTGIRVEEEKLADMSKTLSESAASLQAQIYALAGHDFNLQSPKQLSAVLFEEMGVAPVKKNKTGYSTDAEVLEQLAETQPIAAHILEYRLVSKLKSTYTDGLRALIDKKSGKLHTTFTQTVTATGRLSSVEPNLQNIPVRHELGRRIRQVFVADKPGDILLSADYNQIELRVLAHMSGDEKLIEAFTKGEDIHTRTASEVFGVPPEQVDKQMRRSAKAVNFGIVYGISDYGLSRDLSISRKQAGEYIQRYFQRYPQVEAYQKQVVENGSKNGYVTTICGRRRYLPDLNSLNHNLRSFSQRMAMNTPIQGSAADIIKIAMLNIAAGIEAAGLRSQMLLQVHDELIFNMPPEERDILPGLVRRCMEQAMLLDVPLTVDIKTGPDWYHME
ncbi:MAG: DNA polymerase I [Firmicutes bacterium]|nr:DNA polymerase I [Bacillota bacterium]